MQIKSWQIVLIGIITHLFIGQLSSFLFSGRSFNINDIVSSFVYYNVLTVIYLPYVLIGLILSVVILFLLYFEKTRKNGAKSAKIFGAVILVFNILLGIYFMLAKTYLYGAATMNTEFIDSFFSNGGIIGIFLLIAGINYFWKKA